jgi:hypothetical protein
VVRSLWKLSGAKDRLEACLYSVLYTQRTPYSAASRGPHPGFIKHSLHGIGRAASAEGHVAKQERCIYNDDGQRICRHSLPCRGSSSASGSDTLLLRAAVCLGNGCTPYAYTFDVLTLCAVVGFKPARYHIKHCQALRMYVLGIQSVVSVPPSPSRLCSSYGVPRKHVLVRALCAM